MASVGVPANFKQLQHYLKTAVEHDNRDAVVSYYCRLYALQKGMEIDRKSPDCRNFLTSMMNALEEMKKQYKDLEAIQNEIVGQAHLENYALKLFLYADNEDRAGRFGKNVVKSFYSAGMLMDVLTTFGELSEDLEKNRKYAKWKAAYIHNCLKNGETPQSGPLPDDNDMSELGAEFGAAGISDNSSSGGHSNSSAGARGPSPMDMSGAGAASNFPPHAASGGYNPGGFSQPQMPGFSVPPNQPNYSQPGYGPPPGATQPNYTQPGFGAPPAAQFPNPNSHPVPAPRGASPSPYSQPAVPAAPQNAAGATVALRPEDQTQTMKYCKFATSALQYEDTKTAIENVTKALHLLAGRKGPIGGVANPAVLKAEDYTRAMKLCKFATSALQYDDAKTAIENLTKALNLLTTGRE